MKKLFKRFGVALLCASMIVPNTLTMTDAAKKPKLSNKSIIIKEGATKKLIVKNFKGKVSWKSDNKKVATVSSKGVVKGKKHGQTKVIAKVRKNKLTCKVKVVSNKPIVSKPTVNTTPVVNVTETPVISITQPPVVKVTESPIINTTEHPVVNPTIKPTEEPTTEPTSKPTAEPTSKPTTKPTTEPTSKPTTEPTGKPTAEPTGKPRPTPWTYDDPSIIYRQHFDVTRWYDPDTTGTAANGNGHKHDGYKNNRFAIWKVGFYDNKYSTTEDEYNGGIYGPDLTNYKGKSLSLTGEFKYDGADRNTVMLQMRYTSPVDYPVMWKWEKGASKTKNPQAESLQITGGGSEAAKAGEWHEVYIPKFVIPKDAKNDDCDPSGNPYGMYIYFPNQPGGQLQYTKDNTFHFRHFMIKVNSETADPVSTPRPTATPTEAAWGWTSTWGTAEEKNDINSGAMSFMPLEGTTVRQIIKVTTSGDKFKLRLSNQYGASAVEVESMHLAKQGSEADKSTIDASTDTVVTVGGEESFEIPAGKVIETDEIAFSVNALENVAISTYFASTPTTNVTGHRGARATTYQVSGNSVSDETFVSPKTCKSWFFLADASVWMQGGKAVVCFGDSITDGYGTDADYLGKKPDSYTRWGDYFAKRLQANESTKNVSVINEGIGANSILGSYPTDAGKDRFERDLTEHDGVAYCIILFGVNDLDALLDTSRFALLKPEYEKMIETCHDYNIKVYAAPILPFGTSPYYSESSEEVRNMINDWFRSEDSGVDGIIDFDKAVMDPNNPKNILEEYTHSDGLHPYDGYDVMADAIDLKLFE